MLISAISALPRRMCWICVEKYRVIRAGKWAIGDEIIREKLKTIFPKKNSIQFFVNKFTTQNFFPSKDSTLYISIMNLTTYKEFV